MDNVINFFYKKNEYRSLSNFWQCDITIIDDNITRIYESGEHCFHGEKYIRLSKLSESVERKQCLLAYGTKFMKPSLIAKTSNEAKKLGGKKGLLLNSIELNKWNQISIIVQSQICKFKFDNYNEVRNDLIKSGNKILIHPAMRCSDDKLINELIWNGRAKIDSNGNIVIIGRNILGQLWMDLRNSINLI